MAWTAFLLIMLVAVTINAVCKMKDSYDDTGDTD